MEIGTEEGVEIMISEGVEVENVAKTDLAGHPRSMVGEASAKALLGK